MAMSKSQSVKYCDPCLDHMVDISQPVDVLSLFFNSLKDVFPAVASGDSNASQQGGIQAISLAVTLGIALLGGAIVGRSSFLPLSFFTSAEK